MKNRGGAKLRKNENLYPMNSLTRKGQNKSKYVLRATNEIIYSLFTVILLLKSFFREMDRKTKKSLDPLDDMNRFVEKTKSGRHDDRQDRAKKKKKKHKHKSDKEREQEPASGKPLYVTIWSVDH